MPIWRAASREGSSWMRTAYFCEPKTSTWATPLTIEMRWARTLWAYSSTVERGSVGELRANRRMELSAGLTLRYEGGLGMFCGRSLRLRAIIACTSCAAASISRLKLNWSVIWVRPRVLLRSEEHTSELQSQFHL